MNETEFLADRFEQDRAHLRGVAHRMLGSLSAADDALHEARLRLSRSDTGEQEDLTGWLTIVVGRVCRDILRSRASQRAEPAGPDIPAPIHAVAPEHEVLLADSVGLALLLTLEALAPAERVAFVLHDLFAMPVDEIAAIVGQTPTAAQQLAANARRQIRREAPPSRH